MKHTHSFKPFLSVTLMIFTMLSIVFTKMEARRVGYSLLKDSRQYKVLLEQQRMEQMNLAQLVRPERIEGLAQKRLSLKRPQKGQIVQLAGSNLVLQN